MRRVDGRGRAMRVSLRVNGVDAEADCWEGESLLFALREKLGYPGVEERLRAGRVRLVLGAARRHARLRVPRARGAGRRARGDDGRGARRRRRLHRVQEAFVEAGAVQCGFCTPGLVVAAADLLDRVPEPVRRRDPRGALGQPLPLHRLREDLRRGATGRQGRLRMNRHEVGAKDTLRGAARPATITVGGGWSTPHPGWGRDRWTRRRSARER